MFNFPLLPEQASTYAAKVDIMFWALTIFVLGFAVAITAVFVFLGIKYKRDPKGERPSEHVENLPLELTWTIIPAFIALAIFAGGAVLYYDLQNKPENTLDITVIGKQWMWKVQHPNGMREVNQLTIPVGQPINLIMTSQDVIHSFYVPAFRVKQDVLPARYTEMWFEATKIGEYPFFCAEYCGTEHSTMVGTVRVLSRADYRQWLDGGPALTPVQAGENLFTMMGCATCHAAGDTSRGPALEGAFGTETPLRDGRTVLFDEDHIRTALMTPMERVREGYAPIMPSFAGQLDDEDIMNLVAYIKSLSDAQ